MSQSGRSRAESDAEKSERRMQILAAALELFAQRDGELSPMSEVAARAGVAKGTLYLYFRTKEEIFLALFEEHVHAWIDRLERLLPEGPAGAAEVAARIASSGLADRPLLRLAALASATLEPRVDPTLALRFRRGLERHLEIAGAQLERALAAPPTLLRDSVALLFGLWQRLEPPPAVRALLAPAEVEAHDRRVESEVRAALGALWRGAGVA